MQYINKIALAFKFSYLEYLYENIVVQSNSNNIDLCINDLSSVNSNV